MRHPGPGLTEEISALGGLSREDLSQRWRDAYGVAPPKGLRHDLLVRSAAWHVQAKRLGGLLPATRRALKAAMAAVERATVARVSDRGAVCKGGTSGADKVAGSHRKHLAPGARLIREWNGERHVIAVIEGGFVFEAKVYNSLTAIAHQITGTHWSGPRFFGL